MEDNPPPVRFRIVLELTFPDADPWDPSDYSNYLDQVQRALEVAPNVKCADIVMRDAGNIGPGDDYNEWRGGCKYDFSSLAPGIGAVFGVSHPLPAVDAGDLGRVWQILSTAESGGMKEHLEIAVGRAMKTDSDTNAILARAYVLRVLQGKKLVPAGCGEDLLQKAASFPLAKPPMTESDLLALAALFQ